MRISRVAWPCMAVYAVIISLMIKHTNSAPSADTQKLIHQTNKIGPYLGLVIPNSFELEPLLQSPNFNSTNLIIDFSGRRFRFGTIAEKKVILVMKGLSMINAGITTQLLNNYSMRHALWHIWQCKPSFNIADVLIPKYWSHTALWNCQIYGNGPQDELSLESQGDYTRKIGYLKFSNYTVNVTGGSSFDNMLNNIWFQPEEVFPIDGTPEQRQHAFWIAVDPFYYKISKKLEVTSLLGISDKQFTPIYLCTYMDFERCLNSTTCFPLTPKVALVERGTSASIFLSNAAYRSFLYDKFNISPLDMESASVALICLQQRVPFIAIRALSSGLTGGGSGDPTEAGKFISLASKNSVTSDANFTLNQHLYIFLMFLCLLL